MWRLRCFLYGGADLVFVAMSSVTVKLEKSSQSLKVIVMEVLCLIRKVGPAEAKSGSGGNLGLRIGERADDQRET